MTSKILIDAILGRRSIRRFSNEAVSPDDVTLMVDCALAAPSACNHRPAHLIVVTHRQTIDRFAEIHHAAAMAKQAALLFVFCAAPEQSEVTHHYWRDDCAAAMENLLLASHALGYGAVWCGGIHRTSDAQQRRDGLRQLFHVPDDVEIFGYAIVGRPAEAKLAYGSAEANKVHSEIW